MSDDGLTLEQALEMITEVDDSTCRDIARRALANHRAGAALPQPDDGAPPCDHGTKRPGPDDWEHFGHGAGDVRICKVCGARQTLRWVGARPPEPETARDTERLDVAQELFAGFKGIYPHEPVFARLRLPHGTMESSDLRVLLDGVIAQRDGTAKP